jgi:hypothetical protein
VLGELEESWLADKRRKHGAAEAPLLCRQCNRLEKLRDFTIDELRRDQQLFINGFRLACARAVIYTVTI